MSFVDRLKQLKQKTQVKKTGTDSVLQSVSAPRSIVSGASASLQPTGDAYRVLIRPLVSEKAVSREAKGVYTFVVGATANKEMVKDAVRRVYGVVPERVRIMNVEGKIRRFARRSGRRVNWKKAIITLSKGKTISIHEGV